MVIQEMVDQTVINGHRDLLQGGLPSGRLTRSETHEIQRCSCAGELGVTSEMDDPGPTQSQLLDSFLGNLKNWPSDFEPQSYPDIKDIVSDLFLLEAPVWSGVNFEDERGVSVHFWPYQ